jgi:hypothetical protein
MTKEIPMNFSEIPFHPARKTLRLFAALSLVFFLAIGIYQYMEKAHHTLGTIFVVLALIIGPLGLIKPEAVRWIFVSWMVLAFPIGWLVSQLMLAVLFYLVLTPVAILFRLRGRDLLCRKHAPGRTTFWLPKQTPQDARSYFRQY